MFVDVEKVQPRNQKVKGVRETAEFDLLEIPFFKKLIKWNGFPLLFQIIILIILSGFIYFSWGKYAPADEDPELYARLNLISLLIWCIWWPAIIISVIILGRIWCMICPLELVSRLSGKLGTLLNIPRFQLNDVMRNGTIILFLYLTIQLLVPGIGLHEVPAYSAFFFSALIFLAVLSGLFYKNGSFCKAFCPVSFTLSAYSRGGMLAVRAATKKKCTACGDKNCIRIVNKSISAPRSCPGNLYLPRMQNSKDCLLCGQCIKSCPSENVQFLLRPPFSRNDIREKTSPVCITLFIMIESGFVIGELAEEWPAAEKVYLFLPALLINNLGLQSLSGWIMGLWSLILFPLVTWTVITLPKRLHTKTGLISLWRNSSFRILILISAGHLIKSLLKFSESVSYIPLALSDPGGTMNLKAIHRGELLMPDHLLNNHIMFVLSIIILSPAVYFYFREGKISNNRVKNTAGKI